MKWNQLVLSIAIIITQLGVCISAESQPKTPHRICNYRHYSITEGLSSNTVTSIKEDSKGFLWIGTRDGLCRYDGYKFREYTPNPNDSVSIIGKSICTTIEDPIGNIWVATFEGGINILDTYKNTFSYFGKQRQDKGLTCGITSCRGLVYYLSDNQLMCVNPKNRETTSIKSFDYRADIDVMRGMRLCALSDSCTIAIGGINSFCLYNSETHAQIEESMPNIGINDFYLKNDSLLIATNKGMFLYRISQQKLSKIDCKYADQPACCIIRNGDKFWIASQTFIWEALPRHQPKIVIDNISAYTNKLSQITALFLDENELLWIGTNNNGVVMLDTKQPHVSLWEDAAYMASNDVFADSKNSIWFAVGENGVAHVNFDSQNSKSTTYPIAGEYITAVLKCPDERVFIGSRKGVFLFDNKTVHKQATTGLVTDLCEDCLGNIWASTGNGLYKCNADTFVRVKLPSDSANSRYQRIVNTVFEDSKGCIWAGTNSGVYSQQSDNKPFKLRSATDVSALCFFESSNGDVLVGTHSGLLCYSQNSDTPSIPTCNEDINYCVVFGIAEDEQKRVWISTTHGLVMFENNLTVSRKFTGSDGLTRFGDSSRKISASQGYLFTGTPSSLNFIYTNDLRDNNTPSRPMICDAYYGTFDSHQRMDFVNDSTLTCKFAWRSTTYLNIASSDFTQVSNNKFKVRIDNREWSRPTDDNIIMLPGLMPGRYKVEIAASNSDSRWSNATKVVYLDIVAPLWMNNYTIVFYVLLFLLTIRVILNYRYKDIKRTLRSVEREMQAKHIVEDQRNKLAKAHKDMTDSINYAKRIQDAMMPREDYVKTLFDKLFVLYMPKDIVSGDFYCFFRRNDKTYIISADCTGHGVPGAFISIIGIDHLQNIIMQQGKEDAGDILTSLHREMHSTVFKNQDSAATSDFNDGMDLTVCIVNHSEMTIDFAGAMNDMYLIRDNVITTYHGDRHSIGTNVSLNSQFDAVEYSSHHIKCLKRDVFYLFSDGYVDQFGGPEHKKFKHRRFKHLLLNIHKLPAADQQLMLIQKFNEWKGSDEQTDDVSVIGFAPWK